MKQLNGIKYLPNGYNEHLLHHLNATHTGIEINDENQKIVDETIEIYFNTQISVSW